MTSATQRNLDAVRRYTAGDHDAAVLAPDAAFVDVTTGRRWTGANEIAAMLDGMYRVAFDARVEEPRLVADADAVVLEATFVGRHIGEFAGVAATGAEVRVPLVVVYDLADGVIRGARIHFDVASFLRQVG